jgi:hypothetical protein
VSNSSDLDDERPPAGRCSGCGGCPKWESQTDWLGERWLSVCRCGRMQAFLPEAPAAEWDDPLAIYLHGSKHVSSPAPPWIRLFLHSLRHESTPWRYHADVCLSCANNVVFSLQACPRPSWSATCTLCLSCGRATSEYSQPWRHHSELATSGDAWTPPCPAVQRLRDCILRPFLPHVLEESE